MEGRWFLRPRIFRFSRETSCSWSEHTMISTGRSRASSNGEPDLAVSVRVTDGDRQRIGGVGWNLLTLKALDQQPHHMLDLMFLRATVTHHCTFHGAR